MFTFSPESINETTTETHFTIDMLTHPDDFSSSDAVVDSESDDIRSVSLDMRGDEQYYIDIVFKNYAGEDRSGTVTFNYYNTEEQILLFHKDFSIILYAPSEPEG